MAKILGQLEKAQFENITGNPSTALAPGRVWADITTPAATLMKYYDGTAVQQFMTTSGGVAGQSSVTDGASNVLWLDDPSRIFNLGLKSSVATNAMTITIQNKLLANPTAASPVYIPFRSSTAATGQYNLRAVITALTIVIPSGASLGNVTSTTVPQYVYLCAIDNAGTVELAVIGSRYDLDEGALISTTAISSGATTYNVMYSTTARTNVPFRVLGRFKTQQTTSGTWINNASEISMATAGPKTWPDSTSWVNTNIWTMVNCGSVASPLWQTKRVQDTMFVRFTLTNGTTAAAVVSMLPPTGMTIDNNILKMSNSAGGSQLGTIYDISGSTSQLWASSIPSVVFYDGSTTSALFVAYQSSGSNSYLKTNAAALWNPGDAINGKFEVPIAQWRSY